MSHNNKHSKHKCKKHITNLTEILIEKNIINLRPFEPADNYFAIEIENFITNSDCEYIKALGEFHQFKSLRKYDADYRRGGRALVKPCLKLLNGIYEKVQEYCPLVFVNSNTGSLFKIAKLNEQWSVLRYQVGDHFNGVHSDAEYCENTKNNAGESVFYKSRYSLLIYLNDDYTGGELYFTNGTNKKTVHKIQPKKSTAVLFSQNNLPHYATTITAGTKYILRCDVMYLLSK